MFEIGKSVVNYTYMGRTVVALVMGERQGEVSHEGADGEPLVTVAFLDPERDSAGRNKRPTGSFQPPAAEPQIYVERDVVHASHEFSAEFKRDKGLTNDAQVANLRGHGEWSEVPDAGKLNSALDAAVGYATELERQLAQFRSIQVPVAPVVPQAPTEAIQEAFVEHGTELADSVATPNPAPEE